MTSIANTKVQWQVQVRRSKAHKWTSKGTFETRSAARAQGVYLREGRVRNCEIVPGSGFGFGNTRVVRK
jgi:tRNA (Thr-GGU) A37 N-methylase